MYFRVKRTYGSTWQKVLGSLSKLPRNVLEEVAAILVDEVVKSARRDAARARGLKMKNQIPQSEEFFKSFGYRIVGEHTIEITSTWKMTQDLVEGKGPFEMTWLKRRKGQRFVVPMEGDGGEVIFRMAPLTTEKGWIHPGIAKHTFIAKGLKKARKRVAEVVLEHIQKEVGR